MKKWISWILVISFLFGLTACSRQEKYPDAQVIVPQSETDEITPDENIPEENRSDGKDSDQQNILIAYFSWADNTVVTDEDAAVQSVLSHYESIGDSENYNDADVISSASVVSPGNTAKMAQWIQEYVGGDLFPIVVADPYPDNYDDCMDRAADEKAENARPELTAHLDNMDDYDIIFLGFPNWWYTAPMAVFSFIEEYDFSGKTIIPFCSHGTGGISSSVKDITAELPDSTTVLEPLGIYRAEINEAQPKVEEWLGNLGFQKKQETEEMESNERKLKMTVADQEILITLYNTPAANALYEMLPLELNFEDFNGIEKISYLSETLSTDGEPDGCDPEVGDLCLYAPWGNLSIFYQDFRYSDSLIRLGHIDSGMEWIAEQDNDFSVKLEIAEE